MVYHTNIWKLENVVAEISRTTVFSFPFDWRWPCPINASHGSLLSNHSKHRAFLAESCRPSENFTSTSPALGGVIARPRQPSEGGAKVGNAPHWGNGTQCNTERRGKQTQCSDSCALLLKRWSSRRSRKVGIIMHFRLSVRRYLNLASLILCYWSDLAASSCNMHRSDRKQSSSSQLKTTFLCQ